MLSKLVDSMLELVLIPDSFTEIATEFALIFYILLAKLSEFVLMLVIKPSISF